MIAFLKGSILFADGEKIIISTDMGVGYEVNLKKKCEVGSHIEIYTKQIIREDMQDLYGFESLKERSLFDLLIKVKGVGPKSAYNLLHFFGADELVSAISFENKKLIQKAPGIGPKAAAQIILDIGTKVNSFIKNNILSQANSNPNGIINHGKVISGTSESVEKSDIIKMRDEANEALKELGLSEEQYISKMNEYLSSNLVNSSAELVKAILQEA